MHTIVVDPSRTVLKIVGQLIEAAGHRVHTFSDGLEALDCLRASPGIEAVITSVELPTISGIELCRMARAISSSQRPIYIMVMSSNPERENLVKALEGGADDYIGKPPAIEELYARLRAAERLASMQRDLVQLATTDSLTALLNRRAFFEKAAVLCGQACAGSRLAGIMFDIDCFKRVNDVYGHATGDQVIRAVAKAVMSTTDVVGRLGGEEFAMLLPGRALPGAFALAEKLRADVAALELKAAGDLVKVTLSFGVAEWEFGDTIDDLLRRADLALYQAKVAGRNCVIAYDPSFSTGRASGVIRSEER